MKKNKIVTSSRRSGIRSAFSAAVIFSALFLGAAAPPEPLPRRIISLAPSITEIVFQLGLEDRLVGVSRYCDYPPQAAEIPKIGGFADPNYEAIIALGPDLVVLLNTHEEARQHLEGLGLKNLRVPHQSIADIHESIRLIGGACGKEAQAQQLVTSLERRAGAVERAVRECTRPRVLICIGRDPGPASLTGLYIAGADEYYTEILAMAGGVNAWGGGAAAYPQISVEGVISMDPEVILDLSWSADTKSAADGTGPWMTLKTVSAVKAGRVHLVSGSEAVRPGPRYVSFLEETAALLHPGVFDGGRCE